MRAPPPVALGCISFALCLLELPDGAALPAARSPRRREPPDRTPSPAPRPSPAPLPEEHPAPRPLAPLQPAGGPRRKPLLPRHGPKLIPRHGPQHGTHPAPRHSPKLMPRHGPRHGARLAPRHRPLVPRHGLKLMPRHRPRHRPLIPRHSPKLMPRHGPQHGARPAPGHGHGHRFVLRHGPRGRRHAPGRLQHAQLLRVGCVLGTCQVQNLSHRLWQLMGQSGRQDSSPMNPNSPHSYG